MNFYVKRSGTTFVANDEPYGYGKTHYYEDYQKLWEYKLSYDGAYIGKTRRSYALCTPSIWSAYNSAGVLTTKKEFSTYRDSTYINNLNITVHQYFRVINCNISRVINTTLSFLLNINT